MKHSNYIVLVALVLSSFLTGVAQPTFQFPVLYEPPKRDKIQPSPGVAQWISELSNPSPDRRRIAFQNLLEMGKTIEPQLRWTWEEEKTAMGNSIPHNGGPHVAFAAISVLISHFDDLRKSAPSQVTLHATDGLVTDILREFGPQVDSPVSIVIGPVPSPSARGSIGLDRASYWAALLALQQDLGVSLYPRRGLTFQGRGRGSLDDFPFGARGAIVAGPLIIAPHLQASNGTGGMTLTLQASAEEKVAAGRHAMVLLDTYTDDRGQSLLAGGKPLIFFSEKDPDPGWNWKVRLQLPAPIRGRQPGMLKGEFGVSVGPGGMDLIIIDLKSRNMEFELDDVHVSVKSSQPFEDRYVVAGEISAPSMSPIGMAITELRGSERAEALRAEGFGLLDSSNHRIRREVELGSVRRDQDRSVIEWTVKTYGAKQNSQLTTAQRSLPDPCSPICVPGALVWSTPPETRWLMIPFEFKDVRTGN